MQHSFFIAQDFGGGGGLAFWGISQGFIILYDDGDVLFCRGGSQILGKPELEKVMQRRKLDSEGKAGSIRGDKMSVGGQRSDASSELAAQLSRRSHILEEVCAVCVCVCVCVCMWLI